MAIYQSALVKSSRPGISANRAGQVISWEAEIGSLGTLTTADTFEFGVLPAGHVPVDVILFCDDLDTGATPALVLDVGIEGGTLQEFIDQSTTGQAGGVARPTLVTAFRITPTTSDRKIVGRVATNAAGAPAASAKIGVVFTYRQQQYGT